MKKGLIFQVNHKEYVVAFCARTHNGNAAVLLRRSGGCLTVSNLETDGKGKISWERSYPAGSYDDAVIDLMARINA